VILRRLVEGWTRREAFCDIPRRAVAILAVPGLGQDARAMSRLNDVRLTLDAIHRIERHENMT
jgi:hypothetical protein